jgi:hypothetical protein
VWLLIAIYASPLTDVEVVGISNVLGTQKELIFNLQVRARYLQIHIYVIFLG